MACASIIWSRTMATLRSAKSALRKEIQAVIEKIDGEDKKRQSAKVVEKVHDLTFYKKTIPVASYFATFMITFFVLTTAIILMVYEYPVYTPHSKITCFFGTLHDVNYSKDRNVMKKALKDFPSKMEEKCLSRFIVSCFLLELPQYKESKRISLYLSTKDEINTVPILAAIFDGKKEAFVPMYEGRKMSMVKLHSLEDYEKLPLTKWNIKQPATGDGRDDALETGGLDLIILPGVAFTASGDRLGHGMGYYDKFLDSCIKKQDKKPHLIALAFNEQMRDEIPTTETDVTLDMILTEKTF